MKLPTCRTCPFFFCPPLKTRDFRGGVNVNGECRRSPRYHDRHSDCWCGEHPDFPAWVVERMKQIREAEALAKEARSTPDGDQSQVGGE